MSTRYASSSVPALRWKPAGALVPEAQNTRTRLLRPSLSTALITRCSFANAGSSASATKPSKMSPSTASRAAPGVVSATTSPERMTASRGQSVETSSTMCVDSSTTRPALISASRR